MTDKSPKVARGWQRRLGQGSTWGLGPGDSSYNCVPQRVEVRARDGAKGENQGDQGRACRKRVGKKRDGRVAARELFRRDARADHRGQHKADSFRCQSAGKRHWLVSFCCMFTRAQKGCLCSGIHAKYNRASEYTESCLKRKLI
jgi:hypothetical protein